MSSVIVNVKTVKRCAFCKNWYDPMNSAIEPRNPRIGLWKIKDEFQKCKCLRTNLEKAANGSCSRYFESKL